MPKKDLERSTIVDTTIAELNKKYGSGSIMRLGDMGGAEVVPKFTSGIASLDLALGGGWPYGRIIEVYGPESSGKSSLCLFAMAEVQKLGKRVAFIDLENALDPMLAEMYGVDTNNMYLGYPDTGEAAFAIIEGLAQTGEFGCIVLDSVSAILPNAEREEDVGKSLPAIQARLMSQALRRLVGVLGKSQTTVFFVNQIREKVGVMYGSPEITSGGRALSFYASQRINVRIDTFLDEKGKEQKSRDGAFGHKTNIQVSKNKVAPPFKRAGFILEYGKGFDKYYDVLLVAEELGIIGKGGAWYNYVPEDKSLIAEGEENLRWQGRNNLLNDLKSNHKLFAEIQQKTFKEVGALYNKPKSLEEVMEEPDES